MFVELPAAYLDALALASPGGLALANRDPDSGEVNVPVDGNLSLDIMDTTGIGIDVSATQVFIDGNLAFDAGVFQSGFNGAGSTTSNPDPDTLRIVIDPVTDFPGSTTISIRVVSETTGGANTLDVTYAFTTEDIDAANVIAATGQSLRVIRVRFSEAMRQESETGPNDALNPANYLVEPLTFPAVTVAVVGVVGVSPTEVDLVTDIDLSPGKTYRVSALGVADLAGNLTSLTPGS